MKLEQICQAVEEIAPLKLAQSWDNVGFLVGDPSRDIRRILVTIDTTRAVAAEAKRFKADLILAYHPVIWDGLKRVTADGPTAPIFELIQAGIGVFSIHTALIPPQGASMTPWRVFSPWKRPNLSAITSKARPGRITK
jgi:putative NIF3 family GTP cyclohydrolase 1 type 2